MTDRRLYPSRSLHAKVAHHVGRRIVAGAIPQGAFLPREAELSQQFSVSRQAVREALKVLAAKGLVASRRRTGTHILPRSSWNLLDPDVLAWHAPENIPADFLRDLVELRWMIEPAAAELAATRATPEAIAAIGAALDRMRDALDDRATFIRADVDFHAAICAASGNVLFDRLSMVVEPLLGVSFALQGKTRTRDMIASDTLPLHTAVYDAIVARDGALARQRMESVLSMAVLEVRAIPWDKLSSAG